MSERQYRPPRPWNRPRLAAVVLAAGSSSRMGAFKPLLRIGPCTVTETIIRAFRAAGITEILVVAGHRAEDLIPVAEHAGARCVFNPAFPSGMYSSVCAGVRALPVHTDACFVMPVDIPLVRSSTIECLARHYARWRTPVTYPVCAGRRGHPPLVSCTLLTEEMVAGTHDRLSSLLAAHQAAADMVEVADEGILRDMDTPEAFARLREFAALSGGATS